MNRYCSMHCGRFLGVDPDRFKASEAALSAIFSSVRHDPETQTLDLCGAQHLNHDPNELQTLFDRMSGLLLAEGRGRILLNCGDLEMCFFRNNMWKLVHVGMPEDPFEGLRIVG